MRSAKLRLQIAKLLRSGSNSAICQRKAPAVIPESPILSANFLPPLSFLLQDSPRERVEARQSCASVPHSCLFSHRPFSSAPSTTSPFSSSFSSVLKNHNVLCSASLAVPERRTRNLTSFHDRSISKHAGDASEVFLERLENEDEGIVVVSMNRPSRKNAIGKTFLSEFKDALEDAQSDFRTRVILIRSLLPDVFCAGADLKERREQTALEVQRFVQRLRGAYADLEALKIPSIAVVEGKALGGGCELALACDLRVAGQDALFGLPETGLAIIPGAGATQRLPRIIGKALAKELIYTGTPIGAEKAEKIGLANHTVPAGKAFEKALELARRILTRGPIAIRMAKTAIDRGMEADVTTGLAIEEACYAQLLPTTDRVEALQAFKEKRAPVYKGE